MNARKIRYRALLMCRLLALFTATSFAVLGYPPATAQSKDAAGHDEVIQEELKELKDKIAIEDQKVDKQWLAVNAVKEAQATQNGEVIGFGALLALISGAGLVIQVKKPKM